MIKITEPTLLLNKKQAVRNIFRMVSKARKNGVSFRPHFKTHQSAEIGEWFREFGVDKITVSSVQMAEYFANHGWNDITIAFPVNILEIEAINSLAGKINLNILVESKESAEFIGSRLQNRVGTFLKIDTGYGRTGVPFDDYPRITSIISEIELSDKLNLKGFLTHTGNTYGAKNSEEVLKIHNESLGRIAELKRKFSSGDKELIASIGDTPGCSVADNFNGADEIRPGNFIFYDVMQQRIGSCGFENIAVVLAAPVVALHPERNEIVVYAGAVHLSKESILNEDGVQIFGLPVNLTDNGAGAPWGKSYLARLSQEHGIIKTTPEIIERLKIGDVIGILPVHSCLTARCMSEYFTFENQKIEMMG